ncbi:hypothetical protein BKI52_06515 [marine bacterium AO1-C]|nr:hypothetical protein BKI52_06515 [marine bacterium AO1-C]
MSTNTPSYFQLNTGEKLQGDYTPRAINLAFVFQVNCPGCFVYGIPMINTLYEKYKEKVGFLGISTAFEDFDKNTVANTQLLLKQQVLTGETKKYFVTQGVTKYPQKVLFPVFFDRLTSPEKFLSSTHLEIIQQKLQRFDSTSSSEKANLTQQIVAHYQRLPQIAHTFSLNQLPGTPTFVIYNQQHEIINMFFGRQSLTVMASKLDTLLENQLHQTL